ncbi:helix-turn-helix domain-containing protein [Candidatus Pristimantibacillus sp. PTI5]|uniref:helix-turn-helix domain-containing protein n=1 Tax=Candidatus Pristimantibacillus sp. PTI5 TaxID=3400422 RepID=UPI003B0277EB
MKSHTLDSIKISAGFWKELSQLNIPAHDVVRKSRLPLTILSGTNGVTTAQYFALLQTLSEMVDDPATSIIKSMTDLETTQLSPSVLAAYHARNYRDALHRISRYKQMCAPQSIHITEKGELCTIEQEWLYAEQPEPPMLVGVSLAFLLELGRRGAGHSLTAYAVEFTGQMSNVQVLEAYFGCHIRLGAERNRLTLHRSDLNCPFISYNAELLEILTPALDRSLDEQQRSNSITEMVKWIMKRSLAAGRPDIQIVASELGMSDRTLQRRLTDLGTSFKQLLTEARHVKALEYLADPMLDLKEVAFLLGYEDQSSFYRAFRSWEGDTPSNWRAEQLGTNPLTEDSRNMPAIH